jgi:cysteine desulfurase
MIVRERTYLDYNATAPMRSAVAEVVARASALPGNPSSVHAEGRAARAAVERAREQVAALIGAQPKNVVFTSGGTEAANTVLTPTVRRSREAGPAARLLVGASEHVCVLRGHRFADDLVGRIPVDREGVVGLSALRDCLDKVEGRALVSIQAANNETGVMQPVAEAASLVHARGGLLHCDAVQAAGKVEVDQTALGADILTLSAHKLGGPKGVGAIVFASDRIEVGDRLVRGGGQERGWRAGTENIAAIAGFGAAAALAGQDREREATRLRGLREACEASVRRLAPEAVIFGEGAERLPNTLAFAVPGLKAETALIALDLDGVAVSSDRLALPARSLVRTCSKRWALRPRSPQARSASVWGGHRPRGT